MVTTGSTVITTGNTVVITGSAVVISCTVLRGMSHHQEVILAQVC